MTKQPPIRLALIGAGIYARDAHVPALQTLADRFEVAAVYSRTRANAEALAAAIGPAVEATTDLDALLARDDIEAVDILLPIHVLPEAVERALAAGKHVLSEKPIAPTVARGRALLARWQEGGAGQAWMVGENWRYEPAFVRAAEWVAAGQIGRPLLAQFSLHVDFSPGGAKYYATAWRREELYPGGMVLDGGVHHVAALRLVLGEIVGVQAAITQARDDLPPADTLSAALEFAGGALGSYSVTFATGAPWPPTLHITGTEGALWVQRGQLRLTTGGETRRRDLPDDQGVANELAAFAAAIRDGQPHRNTPAEALRDVAVIEAFLTSAETGQRIVPEPVAG